MGGIISSLVKRIYCFFGGFIVSLNYGYEYKTEIINGIKMMSPPAYSNHNHVKTNIVHLFKTYLKNNICIPFGDGEKVVLPFQNEGDYVVPDFFVICDRSKNKRDGVYGVPDLVVEVLSPRTAKYDKGLKKDLYQFNGVKEYWIIEPNTKSIEVYLLKNNVFELNNYYTMQKEDQDEHDKQESLIISFHVNLFPEMIVNLEDVFEYVNLWEE